jgi:hypothetical protein
MRNIGGVGQVFFKSLKCSYGNGDVRDWLDFFFPPPPPPPPRDREREREKTSKREEMMMGGE